MKLNLKNKAVIVTGASGGIGAIKKNKKFAVLGWKNYIFYLLDRASSRFPINFLDG